MERESFEDEATAALMNDAFVSIKVDREERPDLDGIYMDAVQAMTGHGGWPMSAFLTPDGRPFYAGTYFPPEPRHGMPSFRQVLTGIAEAWDERRDEIVAQAGKVTDVDRRRAASLEGVDDPLTEEVAREAMQALRPSFDAALGRVRRRAEIPAADDAGVLPAAVAARRARRAGDGGDHARPDGGRRDLRPGRRGVRPVLHRRSVARSPLREDALRQRPARRSCTCGRGRSPARIATAGSATETVEYLLREMRHPRAGSSPPRTPTPRASRAGSSRGRWDELVDLVGEPVAACFGATAEGNWEDGRTNVLWRPIAISAVAREHGLDPARTSRRWSRTRASSCSRRGTDACTRPPTTRCSPAWNAMAIRALAEAGRAFDEPRYVEAAARCASFVLTHLRDEGRPAASVVAGRAWPAVPPSVRTMRCSRRRASPSTRPRSTSRGSRTRARRPMTMLRLFADPERGGFFQTGVGRRRVGGSSQGPARQRGAQRELGGRGGAAAPVAPHRRGRPTRRRALGAPPGARRDGQGAHGVRPCVVRAGPVPRAGPRGGDRGTDRRAGDARVDARSHDAPLPTERRRSLSRRPTTRPRTPPSRSSKEGPPLAACRPPMCASASPASCR